MGLIMETLWIIYGIYGYLDGKTKILRGRPVAARREP
jgi:hypothetical protein